MTSPARGVADLEAHQRYWPWWECYFAVVAVAVAVATPVVNPSSARVATAVTAIAAMTAWHLLADRRVFRRSVRDGRAVAVAAGQVALFSVAVAAVPFSTWLLFALIPLFFLILPLRPAIALIVLANLVGPALDLIQRPAQVPGALLIAVISVATAVWLGFWNHRVIEQSTERGVLIAELEASRAEVARLSHEAGVAAERARLAGEIHDTLAQGFTSIITLLQAADPNALDRRLALAVRTARENLAEARALVSALSPAALTSGSLPDSVRRQASRFSEETGVPATVRITGTERPLPTAVEVVLLRAAQEALTNVRRHADARSAQVVLAYQERAVRLVVRDDGCGFGPARADGFGLTGMRARAEQVNGTLTVASAGGGGTTIELEVPS